jgi:hypothetical protein
MDTSNSRDANKARGEGVWPLLLLTGGGGIVCCSCMAASASSSEGSSAQLARAERTVSGKVLRKMALNRMSLLGGVEGSHLGVLGGDGVVPELWVV